MFFKKFNIFKPTSISQIKEDTRYKDGNSRNSLIPQIGIHRPIGITRKASTQPTFSNPSRVLVRSSGEVPAHQVLRRCHRSRSWPVHQHLPIHKTRRLRDIPHRQVVRVTAMHPDLLAEEQRVWHSRAKKQRNRGTCGHWHGDWNDVVTFWGLIGALSGLYNWGDKR